MPSSSEIRQQFIDFFTQKHGHTFAPSSPVVPHDDPTLLFTNAGMNQFKPYFLGTEAPPYPRAANSQKCIRAGGKHNDLEDVGKDTYHHTFFEMLGNWSFGDYFKQEAIDWAWELLTQKWGLDPSRLHATYFEGDESEGLQPDLEAKQLWQRYLPDERIHPGNKKDNFWEMGDTGPCGPCSEIHIDRTPGKDGGKLVNGDDARVMEIWNLVFIQYNRSSSGKLSPLPARHVDTGMGFERICAVIASKDRGYDPAIGNYDTDVFTPLFKAIQSVTGARAYSGKLEDKTDTAYRILADHVRCLTFALTDGAVPSNEGRGYVLRRILRRAFRTGKQTLGQDAPFLHQLVPAVADAMGDAFPELKQHAGRVADLVREEEEGFARTIDRGIALFEDAAKDAKRISAEDAFKLYDTYGFPLDLTQVMAEERGMTVDVEGFACLMEEARERSRAVGGGADEKQSLVELVQKGDLPATDFVGYEQTESMPREQALRLFVAREGAFEPADSADRGTRVAVVVEQTPFYAEMGGQVADTGTIQVVNGGRVKVETTQKVGDVVFHIGEVVEPIQAAEKASVALAVIRDRRARIMANHTATHLLNLRLRAILGDHVQQKGSLVDENRLRFDFSHNEALTPEQIAQIEEQVSQDIAANLPVYDEEAPLEEARKINTLRAVFGEKYPSRVRVVSVGVPVGDLLADPAAEAWMNYSVEFCGGTHLKSTGEAEGFVLTSEEAVAKGVRRVTALTGPAAREAAAEADRLLKRIDTLRQAGQEAGEARLRDEIANVTQAVADTPLPLRARQQIQAGVADLQATLKALEKERSKAAAAGVVDTARKIAEEQSGDVIVATLDGADAESLRTAMDVLRKKHPDSALLLAAAPSGDKVAVVASVPQSKIKAGLKAGDWVREVAKVVGGGGGGRPDMAQAGGKDPSKLPEALDTAKRFAASKIG